jgi:hypothetical protein
MLSDKETSITTAFVDNHPVAALTGRSEGREWLPFTDSFFFFLHCNGHSRAQNSRPPSRPNPLMA